MAGRGRPRKLDDEKCRHFCALVSMGASRRRAARFVGVSGSAVRHAVLRDPAFADMVRRAEMNREVVHLQNIRDAGGRSWRASAWMLERLNPDDFRPRGPNTFSVDDVKAFFEGLGEVIATAIPTDDVRDGVLSRLKRLLERKPAEG